MNVYDVLKEKGITLPAPPPKGGVYTPVQEFGPNLLYCSGCSPDLGNGNTYVGKLVIPSHWRKGRRQRTIAC